MRGPLIRVTVLVAVIAVGVAAASSGVTTDLGDADRVREVFTESGAWGPIAFVVAFSLLHPVGVPSVAFVVAAGLMWPVPTAVGLSWVGSLLGPLLCFSFARWLARDWVSARVPPRFARLQDGMVRRAVPTVMVVRLTTFLPPPADWVFGISPMRTRDFLVGTAVGVIPPIVFLVVLGEGAARAAEDNPVLLAGMATALAAAVLAYVVVRRRRQRRPATVSEV